jgi:asparagine synthase (glutamine-hydrolysing)
MCGITGIIGFKEAVEKKDVVRMNTILAHRGPDGTAVWQSPNKRVVLGHRRLSIIDLSSAGNQPMSDADEQIWITFNGEIYNYVELREELLADGVQFHSHTDTEVIIYLYKKYGVRCLEKLRGMFAFCIVDLKKNVALLARDRIGKKPIIYTYDRKAKQFIFASEIKAVIEMTTMPREIDLDALNHYFSHVYFHVPAPYTIFKGVYKLEPASYMTVQLRSGKIATHRYWQPVYEPESTESFETVKQQYVQEITQAVQLRERSDVPVGVLLSGGLDSSTIVALMQKGNAHTFAIGYDKHDPELHRARIIAKQFNTKHHEFTFENTGLDYLPKLIEHAGEPFNLPSALYAMQLSEKIHAAGIKVVLNGAGADELFCGYSHHNHLLLLTKLMKIKKVTGTKLFSAIAPKQPTGSLGQFLRFMAVPDERTKGELYRTGNTATKAALYAAPFKRGITQKDTGKLIDQTFNLTKTDDTFKKHFYADLALANAHSMTYTSDITGMSYSLEIRSPFLDHELLAFAGKVPDKYKIRSYFSRKQNKYIMKKAAEAFLPKEIIYAKKMGFGYNIHLHALLRTELRDEVHTRLFRGNLAASGLFNMGVVRELFESHMNGAQDTGITLMSLLCFEEWYKQYMT